MRGCGWEGRDGGTAVPHSTRPKEDIPCPLHKREGAEGAVPDAIAEGVLLYNTPLRMDDILSHRRVGAPVCHGETP